MIGQGSPERGVQTKEQFFPVVSGQTVRQCQSALESSPEKFVQQVSEKIKEKNKVLWNYLTEVIEGFSERTKVKFLAGAVFVWESFNRQMRGKIPVVSQETIESLLHDKKIFVEALMKRRNILLGILFSDFEKRKKIEKFKEIWTLAQKESGYAPQIKMEENLFLDNAIKSLGEKNSIWFRIGAVVAYDALKRQCEAEKLAQKFGL